MHCPALPSTGASHPPKDGEHRARPSGASLPSGARTSGWSHSSLDQTDGRKVNDVKGTRVLCQRLHPEVAVASARSSPWTPLPGWAARPQSCDGDTTFESSAGLGAAEAMGCSSRGSYTDSWSHLRKSPVRKRGPAKSGAWISFPQQPSAPFESDLDPHLMKRTCTITVRSDGWGCRGSKRNVIINITHTCTHMCTHAHTCTK